MDNEKGLSLYVKGFDELSRYELYDILKLRQGVFVLEQKCLYPDIDCIDKRSWHVMAYLKDKLVSYARLYARAPEEAQIGRVLTESRHRKNGLARKVVGKAIDAAIHNMNATSIYLESQVYARRLYESLGFSAYGEVFLEDGIPHIRMRKSIKPEN